MTARVGAGLLWASTLVALADGSTRVGALTLGLAAIAATGIAIAGRGRPAAGVSVLALVVCSWASASGLVPQVFPWDDLEHALLAFGFCWFLGDLIAPSSDVRWLVGAAAFGLTMAAGATWEVVEWTVDQALGTHMSPSDADTVTDLLADLIGAGTAAVVGRSARGTKITR
jgi:hypothetical protein